MSPFTAWLSTASYGVLFTGGAAILALPAHAQAPVQFTSEIQVRDLDGGTGTGKLFVGPTRQRMEFPAFGETRPTIIDSANGNQYTLSPRLRKYTDMPYGESGGPVRIPKLLTVDPNNPCAGGDLSDCRRLGAETINGFATQKWEYNGIDGERVTAWIATRLRFPIKTTDDNGGTTELRNVTEGAQPAALFQLPAGYAQVDDLGGSGNPIADAIAGVNPAIIQQAIATARQNLAINNANPQLPARAALWEAGNGYVVNFTVTFTASRDSGTNVANQRIRSNISMRYTASFPLNYVTPAVPPTVGPAWSLLTVAGSGKPQAEAVPTTMSLEWQEQIDRHVDTGRCEGIEQDRSDTVTTVRGRAASRAPITQPTSQGYVQGAFKLNGLMTTYDVFGGVSTSNPAEVVTTARRVDHCAGDRVTNTTTNTRPTLAALGSIGLDVKNKPLPPTPAGLQGTQTVPLQWNGYTAPATYEWTIVPIAAR